MSLHRACCCGDQCIDDCCVWWACAGSGQRQMTLSGNWSVYGTCDDGTTPEAGNGNWTLTATLTRIGTDCSSYRWIATTANLQMAFRWWSYSETLGDNCDVPGSGSQNFCTHCDDCTCGSVLRRKCTRSQYTYNGPVTGHVGPVDPNIPIELWPFYVNGAVITIACMDDPCAPGCVRPVLLFNPGEDCEDVNADINCRPAGCIDVLEELINDGSPPCCNQTYGSQVVPLCLPKWAVLGKSECLSNTTFDGADFLFRNLGCQPFFPAETSPCNNYSPDCVTPATCSSMNFIVKNCDECRDYRDNLHACYEFDANNNEVFICYPSPPVVCCSYRVANNLSWNIV